MTTLHLAQISDLHISAQGDQYDMLSGRSVDFLGKIVTDLNQQEDLDFVLITGDLINDGSRPELELFQQAISSLHKPYYVVPGNHDHHPAAGRAGLTRLDFAHHFNPQFEARSTTSKGQVGYWSLTVKPDIQLIGLDSIRDEDWGGIIGPAQVEWLRHELARHADKLIILSVHHPLHELAAIDRLPEWRNFVCDNGAEMLTLLDDHPQVKVVLTAHHHLTRVDQFGQRLHLACPAVAVYPCAYRTLRLQRQSDQAWQIEWQTHPATDETTVAEARHRMVENWRDQAGLAEDFVEDYVRIAWGRPEDRNGQASVGG